MTVSDLIKCLQQRNPDALVVMWNLSGFEEISKTKTDTLARLKDGGLVYKFDVCASEIECEENVIILDC